jgi:hypothetical protein
MRSFSDVISAWPGRGALAADCGTTYGVVKQWERRNSVPAEYWLRLIQGAEARGIRGLTLRLLAEIAAGTGGSDGARRQLEDVDEEKPRQLLSDGALP